MPSCFANRLISWATGVRLHDYGCSLKAMRAEVVRGLRLYGEMHRFIPAVASWMGVRLAEVPVNHRPRTRGRSKYGIGPHAPRAARPLHREVPARLRHAARAPLRRAGASSSAAPASAILAYLDLASSSSPDEAIGGRPLLLLGALLFLTGVILVCFGLLAEMLVRTYHESQGKPIYVVKEPAPRPKTARTSPRCAGVDRASSS